MLFAVLQNGKLGTKMKLLLVILRKDKKLRGRKKGRVMAKNTTDRLLDEGKRHAEK